MLLSNFMIRKIIKILPRILGKAAIFACAVMGLAASTALADVGILQKLVVQYKLYHLTLPTPSSQLVVVKDDSCNAEFLGFTEYTNKRPLHVVIGPYQKVLASPCQIRVINPTNSSPDALISGRDCNDLWAVNLTFCTAIQCEEMGWHRLALELFDRSLAMVDYYMYFQAGWDTTPPELQLKYCAWNYRMQELVKPASDRRAIAGELKILLKSAPSIATEKTRELYAALIDTVTPSQAPANSAEAAIDELTELQGEGISLPDRPCGGYDPRYLRILKMGFPAVPDLIKHWDDTRLIRTDGPIGYAGQPDPRIERVSYFVRLLLNDLAGYDVGFELGKVPESERAAKMTTWYNQVKNLSEEKYLLDHFKSENPRFGVNRAALVLLLEKYPATFNMLIKQYLNDKQSSDFVEAVCKSSLTWERKTEFLSSIVQCNPKSKMGQSAKNLLHDFEKWEKKEKEKTVK